MPAPAALPARNGHATGKVTLQPPRIRGGIAGGEFLDAGLRMTAAPEALRVRPDGAPNKVLLRVASALNKESPEPTALAASRTCFPYSIPHSRRATLIFNSKVSVFAIYGAEKGEATGRLLRFCR